jgi:primosomal protein N' (replication factor Y)
VIQTGDPSNAIIRMVLRHDYPALFMSQLEERKNFSYPPFCRLIRISLRHKDRALLNTFSDDLGHRLRDLFGKRVLGPEFPVISRIQQWYIKNILLKIERDKPQGKAWEMIRTAVEAVEKEKGASGLRVVIDVDPY